MVFWSLARRRRRQLAELNAQERWCLLQATVLLPAIAVGRRLLSFRRLQALLGRVLSLNVQKANMNTGDLDTALRVARMVQIAAYHGLFSANCLERSLVLWSLLRRQGIVSELQIGVWKHGTEFEAHTWVEYQGVVLNDTDNVKDRYLIFPTPTGRT